MLPFPPIPCAAGRRSSGRLANYSWKFGKLAILPCRKEAGEGKQRDQDCAYYAIINKAEARQWGSWIHPRLEFCQVGMTGEWLF